MRTIHKLLSLVVLVTFPANLAGADPAEIEIQTGRQTLRGKVVAHNDDWFWLMERDGRLQKLGVGEVSEFRQISSRFQGLSAVDLRDQMRREFGNEYEIVGTGHYLVCAARRDAQKYAGLFEDLYRTLHVYCSARGFRVREPEVPLVAIVFPDHARFAAYARQDGVTAGRGLRGYYLLTSNRIALFDDGGHAAADPREIGREPAFLRIGEDVAATPFRCVPGRETAPRHFPAVDADVKDTIIHEATHQVAFNIGLHTRIGQNPRWVVEGFATMLEPAGMRSSGAGRSHVNRINPDRFVWFGNYAKSRRGTDTLEEFVASDRLFATGILDAYSQAWALSFFLVETRSSQYSKYLGSIVARDPLQEYGPAERVADFKRAFGGDLKLLDAEFLRFVAGIK